MDDVKCGKMKKTEKREMEKRKKRKQDNQRTYRHAQPGKALKKSAFVFGEGRKTLKNYQIKIR